MLCSSLLASAAWADQIPAEPQAGPAVAEPGLPLYLEVFLGERPTNLIAHLVLRDGRLFATPEELSSLGLRLEPGLTTGTDGFLALDSLPGLEYRYDAGEQRLYLKAPPALRPEQLLGYRVPSAVEATRGRGLLLNYDLYGHRDRFGTSLAIGSALRWFGTLGTLEMTGISRVAAGDTVAYQRLDTRWSYSDPKHLWTWAAGDLITGSLPWSNSVRLGGVQWRRNFAVRPDLITFPVPRFSGQATVPSTVDLLVNNVQQFGSEIQDGPFVLDAFPHISGAGEATLVIRDALGRTTQTTVPIYLDSQRLAPGVSDFSFELGKVRRGFADGSSGYGEIAGSASLRRGIADSFTVEAHAEGTADLHLGGVGLVWSPARRWGLVTASVAQSADGGTRGTQRSYGYQWHAQEFGFSMATVRRGKGFRDIGSAEASSPVVEGSKQDRATFWKPLSGGSVSASWLRFRQNDGSRDRIMTVSWSKTLRSSLSIAANAFTDHTTGTGVGISIGYAFAPTLDSSLSFDHVGEDTRSELSVRQRSAQEHGWGWQVDTGDRAGRFVRGSANVRGRFGDTWFGASQERGQTSYFVQAAGGIAWMAGHSFLSSRINDAFAVVNSAGIAGVPVFYENRPVGVTDSHGLLLLPNLHGWQRNRISIDPDLLAGSYRLPQLDQTFTPADGGGFEAKFALVPVHPAILTLHDASGIPVPAGSRGTIDGSDDVFVVGFDGEAYLENAVKASTLRVDLGDVTCSYKLPEILPGLAGAPAQLGILDPIGACQ